MSHTSGFHSSLFHTVCLVHTEVPPYESLLHWNMLNPFPIEHTWCCTGILWAPHTSHTSSAFFSVPLARFRGPSQINLSLGHLFLVAVDSFISTACIVKCHAPTTTALLLQCSAAVCWSQRLELPLAVPLPVTVSLLPMGCSRLDQAGWQPRQPHSLSAILVHSFSQKRAACILYGWHQAFQQQKFCCSLPPCVTGGQSCLVLQCNLQSWYDCCEHCFYAASV